MLTGLYFVGEGKGPTKSPANEGSRDDLGGFHDNLEIVMILVIAP
jgi:hypothetical protein